MLHTSLIKVLSHDIVILGCKISLHLYETTAIKKQGSLLDSQKTKIAGASTAEEQAEDQQGAETGDDVEEEKLEDDELDFRDAPQPRQPSQLRQYSDEDDDDDEGLVQTIQVSC